MSQLKVGVVGLGLIGGSMARAYSAAGHAVLAHDINTASLAKARSNYGARLGVGSACRDTQERAGK